MLGEPKIRALATRKMTGLPTAQVPIWTECRPHRDGGHPRIEWRGHGQWPNGGCSAYIDAPGSGMSVSRRRRALKQPGHMLYGRLTTAYGPRHVHESPVRSVPVLVVVVVVLSVP